MALSKSESDYFGSEDVAPSFQIERRRDRTALQVVGEAIIDFNRRADDHVPRKVWPKTFEPRPEPPINTLVGDVPNFSADRTSRLARQPR
jgi:hypothetical protein